MHESWHESCTGVISCQLSVVHVEQKQEPRAMGVATTKTCQPSEAKTDPPEPEAEDDSDRIGGVGARGLFPVASPTVSFWISQDEVAYLPDTHSRPQWQQVCCCYVVVVCL